MKEFQPCFVPLFVAVGGRDRRSARIPLLEPRQRTTPGALGDLLLLVHRHAVDTGITRTGPSQAPFAIPSYATTR